MLGALAQVLKGDAELNTLLANIAQTPGVQNVCGNLVRQMVHDPSAPVSINGHTTTGNQLKNLKPDTHDYWYDLRCKASYPDRSRRTECFDGFLKPTR